MSSNIVLGLATRQNLLALQQINTNMDTAQNHLATGLKVASAVDDAVKFFQSQALTQRANDISTRKDQIDQGISTLTAATNGVQAVVTILQQMQGIINTAKTETASQRAGSATQFNTLAKQLNNLVNDTSYQGLNLINSTTSTLSLQFSISSTSTMKIKGVNLNLSKLITAIGGAASTAASKLAKVSSTVAGFSKVSNKTSIFDNIFNTLQTAVFTAQSDAQTLGGNVTFLQTRLDFSAQYLTTLQGGSDKLVVADVNEESTNLVTLQTRQQLSIQSLSIATQSEQSVLRLFH
ncbi:MAG TPA: flagellin [Stellaceae bacterium]|nr:flagellin [Stellaceae bacterium]